MRLHRRRNARRRRGKRGGLRRDDVVDDRNVMIARVQVLRLQQQPVDLPDSDPGIRVDHRRHIDPVGPGLRHQRIGLQLVQQVLALLVERLDLLGRSGVGQGGIGGIELLV